MFNRRGILYITGALIVAGPPVVWLAANVPPTPRGPASPPVALASDQQVSADQTLERLAKRDPMALVHLGKKRYDQNVRQFKAVLLKQERLDGNLSELQEIELRYREDPFSVYMIWKSGADQARRALHVDNNEFVDDEGRKLTRVEPAGAIARLFVKDIMIPMHGEKARKASRRTIDEAGFRSTFDLLETYNAIAKERGVLDLNYRGTSTIDGRPTYVIVRDLPYAGPDGPYPDARMVLHLDQEWLLPVAVYSYADHQEEELLGSYVFSNIEINPDFEADAFKF